MRKKNALQCFYDQNFSFCKFIQIAEKNIVVCVKNMYLARWGIDLCKN